MDIIAIAAIAATLVSGSTAAALLGWGLRHERTTTRLATELEHIHRCLHRIERQVERLDYRARGWTTRSDE